MKIVLLGSGNVATHLAKALKEASHTIVQIYSRSPENAQILSKELGAEAISDLRQLHVSADLYILSLKDDVLTSVIAQMPALKGIVVHTAGSITMDVLKEFPKHGVFYPFQTFTKEAELDFSDVPVLIESNSTETTAVLLELGRELSNKVLQASSEQRGNLHIAAVFACNFTNHMYRMANKILQDSDLSFDLLHPLISETAAKVIKTSPSKTQTGPASRKDYLVIEKHLNALKEDDELHDVYQMLTDSVVKWSK